MQLNSDNFIRTEKESTGQGALYTMYFRTSYGIVMKMRVTQDQYFNDNYNELYPIKKAVL